jgi:hypothetical protein
MYTPDPQEVTEPGADEIVEVEEDEAEDDAGQGDDPPEDGAA